jgi:predicted MPP superfamily phosphohydrolase
MYAPLEARLGKYAIVGNWENWARVDRAALEAAYRRAGVAFLDNDVTVLEALGVRLVGLDESRNGWPDWTLVGAAPLDLPMLLLHHSPGEFDRPFPEGLAVLMLSGHTHGGQIAPLGRPLILPPGCGGYLQGLYRRGPSQMYVTRGVGTSHLPLRIGARPEIAILDVERSAPDGR